MFEDLIMDLEAMQVEFDEDYELGNVSIDVSTMEKDVLIEVINVINNYGMPFTIDATYIVVEAGSPELPDEEDYSLDEMLEGM